MVKEVVKSLESQIWGLRHITSLERVQSKLLCKVLGVSRYTPDYLLRLETGRSTLHLYIIKKALLYWLKLLMMSNDRYTKKCFNALRELPDT